jgi:hypothetical protein
MIARKKSYSRRHQAGAHPANHSAAVAGRNCLSLTIQENVIVHNGK